MSRSFHPPMSLSIISLLGFSFLLSVICIASLRKCWQRTRQYPPGPTRLPIIGNLLDVPTKTPWITYAKWSEKYGKIISCPIPLNGFPNVSTGDLIYMDVIGQPVIVINSLKIATDLLDKRSTIYSDRPQITMPKLLSNLLAKNQSY